MAKKKFFFVELGFNANVCFHQMQMPSLSPSPINNVKGVTDFLLSFDQEQNDLMTFFPLNQIKLWLKK